MRQVNAKANVPGLRQETQFTCMAASLCGALRAWGKSVSEKDVNRVLGCQALRGASWEEALATAQYFGMRGTLVVPATIEMLRDWTSRRIPVLIAWNPEKRPWSHASTVYDVDDDGNVWVMDPNIPDPNQTTRIVPKEEFYKLWSEKVNDSLIVRRPAMAVEREITIDGRQVMASAPGVDQVYANYQDALRQLEASVDVVALAANKMKSLGLDPDGSEYPFAEDINTVASDIYRWRGAVDQKYTPQDQSRVASRVARRFLEK